VGREFEKVVLRILAESVVSPKNEARSVAACAARR
jgi:hypothetical protein